MKNYFIIVAIVFAFASCSKDKLQISKNGNIIGTWELRTYTTGWIMPQTYQPGNGNKYVFNANGTYIKYVDNNIDKQGKYTLVVTSEQDGTKFGKITLTNPDYTDVYSIKDDSFSIGSSLADGPSWEYARIK